MMTKYKCFFLAACSSIALAASGVLPAQALSLGVSLGGISADVGVGSGGVSASASIGGGSTSGGGTSDGGTSGGGTSGGGTSGGGTSGGGTSGGGTSDGGTSGDGTTSSMLAQTSSPAAFANAQAYVGSTLVSSDRQTLGMVKAAQPGPSGRYSVTLLLNPVLGFGQHEVVLLLSPKGKPTGSTRIAMTANQFRAAIAPQVYR